MLASDGGPVQTVALLGSDANPALDATTRAGTDARGQPGAFDLDFVDNGGASDVGAFELGPCDLPRILSIERINTIAEVTNMDALLFVVTFDEPVAGVDPADFAVTGDSTAVVTDVVDAIPAWRVRVANADLAGFDGEVGLDLASSASISDFGGNALRIEEPGVDQVYVFDNTALFIPGADDILVGNDPGEAGAVVFPGIAFFDSGGLDDFGSDPDSESFFEIGTTTVTAFAIDDAGNEASESFTVTVKDREAPVARARDAAVFLDGNGEATITAAEIDDGSTDMWRSRVRRQPDGLRR